MRKIFYNTPDLQSYFITFCTKNREEYFGIIKKGVMKMSRLGNQASRFWRNIPNHFSDTEIGKWIIMPNHIHGVIFAKNNPILKIIMSDFKKMMEDYAEKQKNPFAWQSDYYSRLITDEYEYHAVNIYIGNNTKLWEKDPNNILNFLTNN